MSFAGRFFPDQNWSDRAVAVVAGWAPHLAALPTRSMSAEFRFLDGPFRFVITAEQVSWTVALVEGAESQTPLAHGALDLDGFRNDFRTAANELIGACQQRGWAADADVVELATALRETQLQLPASGT